MAFNPPPSKLNRPPVDMGCYGAPSAPPQTVTDPCSLLPQLYAAQAALLSGQQTVQVRDGERWISYAPGNAKQLTELIARLQMQCPQSASNPMGAPDPRHRAVRAGPYSNRAYGAPGYGRGSWPWGGW